MNRKKMQSLKNFGKHARECRQASNTRIKKREREREKRQCKKRNQRRFNERKLLDKYKNRTVHCNKQTNKPAVHALPVLFLFCVISSSSCVCVCVRKIFLFIYVCSFSQTHVKSETTPTHTYIDIDRTFSTDLFLVSLIHLFVFVHSVHQR